MQFGRVDNLDEIDLNLPDDHPRNLKLLQQQAATKQQIYFGGTKWGKKEWIGTIYPQEAKAKDLLNHYGQLFNTIELNATFHRFPPESWISKWKDQVPDYFKFCPKVYQSVSHRYYLKNTERLMDEFLVRVQGFGHKLGCMFLQLSDKFLPKRMNDLTYFIERLPKDIDFAVEFRHADWFADKKVTNELSELCIENNVSLVLTDAPGRRDVLHMNLTCPIALIRFVGNDLHNSDYERIDQWVERLKVWQENGLRDFYFLMHQTNELHMLKSLQYFARKVNEKLPTTVTIPQATKE